MGRRDEADEELDARWAPTLERILPLMEAARERGEFPEQLPGEDDVHWISRTVLLFVRQTN